MASSGEEMLQGKLCSRKLMTCNVRCATRSLVSKRKDMHPASPPATTFSATNVLSALDITMFSPSETSSIVNTPIKGALDGDTAHGATRSSTMRRSRKTNSGFSIVRIHSVGL